MSCGSKYTYDYLSSDQTSFLNTSPKNSILIFNDSNQIDSFVVTDFNIDTSPAYLAKGGMFSSDHHYMIEYGNAHYRCKKNYWSFYLEATSNDTYYKKPAIQDIQFANNSTYDYSQIYSIDFSQKGIPKFIGGTQYQNVLALTSGKDTLYWSRSLGILGWKDSLSTYTVYRVF